MSKNVLRKDQTQEVQNILLTPQLAHQYLSRSAPNRPISARHVSKLASAMLRGEWKPNGSTLTFDTNGLLLDGQHRCSAVVESGVSIPTLIVEGVEPETMMTIDTGKFRTAGDVLGIHGHSDGTQLAAAVRRIFAWKRQVNTEGMSHRELSNTAIAEFVRKNRAIREINNAMPQRISRVYPKSALMAVQWLATEAGGYEDRFQEFIKGLETGAGLPPGSPILTLRDWFQRQKQTTKRPVGDAYMFALVRAWNAFAEDRTLTKVQSESRPPQIVGENLNTRNRFQ